MKLNDALKSHVTFLASPENYKVMGCFRVKYEKVDTAVTEDTPLCIEKIMQALRALQGNTDYTTYLELLFKEMSVETLVENKKISCITPKVMRDHLAKVNEAESKYVESDGDSKIPHLTKNILTDKDLQALLFHSVGYETKDGE